MKVVNKKVLISAYALSPFKGSEFGAAWNTIINLAQANELWVLYGVSDEHMGDTESIQEYLRKNVVENVHFIEVRPDFFASSINLLNKIGLTWFFYIAFKHWQWKTYQKAKDIVIENDIDVIHQLGPIGFREPGYLWKINKPFVWGPIGGTAIVEPILLQKKKFKVRGKYIIKNLITEIQFKYSRRVNKAIRHANVLLCARTIDQENIEKVYKKQSIHFPEQGMLKAEDLPKSNILKEDSLLSLVWVGRLDEGKNLSLCLEAVSKLKGKNWALHIIGTGPLLNRSKELSKLLGICKQITWHGHVPRDEAIKIMSQSHLHIITSIGEGNPAVLFEAMSLGLPTLALNHSGMKDNICENCGIKIKIDRHEAMVSEIAVEIERILGNHEMLRKLSIGTKICLSPHTWEPRVKKLDDAYNEAIKKFNSASGKLHMNV